MQGLFSNPSAATYTACAFGFQLLLCIHFALRRWRFSTALRWGWIVYALGLPAGLLGVYGLVSGAEWSWGVAGLLYLVWGLYGWWVEYRRRRGRAAYAFESMEHRRAQISPGNFSPGRRLPLRARVMRIAERPGVPF